MARTPNSCVSAMNLRFTMRCMRAISKVVCAFHNSERCWTIGVGVATKSGRKSSPPRGFSEAAHSSDEQPRAHPAADDGEHDAQRHEDRRQNLHRPVERHRRQQDREADACQRRHDRRRLLRLHRMTLIAVGGPSSLIASGSGMNRSSSSKPTSKPCMRQASANRSWLYGKRPAMPMR